MIGALPRSAFVALAALVPLGLTRNAHAEPPQMREHEASAAVRTESDDGRVSLSIGGFLQARAAFTRGTGLDAEEADPLVSLTRARLYTFGHVHDPSLRYRLMLGTNGGETTFQLFDAYVEKAFAPELRLRIGRTKIPIFRSWVESARMFAGVERDAATVALLPGREVLVMLRGEIGHETLEYAVAAFDSGASHESTAVPAAAARLVWNPMGHALEGEVDFDDTPPALSLGASAMTGRKAVVAVEGSARAVDETLAGAEVLVRAHGFDLGGEVERRERRAADGARWVARGAYARADYYVRSLQSALGVRTSMIRSSDPALFDRDEFEIDGGFYPGRHDAKIVGEIASARVGGAGTRELRAALQLQVAF
jgi:hypothetical protein